MTELEALLWFAEHRGYFMRVKNVILLRIGDHISKVELDTREEVLSKPWTFMITPAICELRRKMEIENDKALA